MASFSDMSVSLLQQVIPDCDPTFLKEVLVECAGDQNATLNIILALSTYPKRDQQCSSRWASSEVAEQPNRCEESCASHSDDSRGDEGPDDEHQHLDTGLSEEEPSLEETPADLAGSWLLSQVEGDFEALMVDAGVSRLLRRLAKIGGYGVGIVRQEIKQDGDKLEITFPKPAPAKSVNMQVKLGVAGQSTFNEDGAQVLVHPRWEGSALYMTGTQKDGSTMQSTRRYLNGSHLVCESITSDGLVVKRIFRRV
jgi:hypothetical protein